MFLKSVKVIAAASVLAGSWIAPAWAEKISMESTAPTSVVGMVP